MRRLPLLTLLALLATLTPIIADSSDDDQALNALPRSTPEAQGVSSKGILSFIEDVDTNVDMMNSFMLVRHGHVVAEAWWAPYDAQTPHVLYSLSKSFTSTAVGLAIAEGKLSIDDDVLKFFPEEAPAEPSANLRSMRVRDLLRMTTGHATEPPMWREEPDSPMKDATWTKKFLHHPVAFKPGTLFVYNTPATYMQSAIVQKATGQTVRDYLIPRLFEPLGIETPYWFNSPQGINTGGYGLLARTEDLAKLGQLYLQKGQWKGKEVLPAAWVDAATSRQTSNGSDPNSDWSQGYGYQFWRSRHNSFRGDGAFGQYCLVLPEQDAVIIITSGVRNMQDVMDRVWDKLLPAFEATKLPTDDSALASLQKKIGSLSVKTPKNQAAPSVAEEFTGVWFEFPENAAGLQAIAVDLHSEIQSLIIRTKDGEVTTPFGYANWKTTPNGYSAGMNRFLSVPEKPLIAASAGWVADNVLSIKLIACETPFSTLLTLEFEDDKLIVDAEHNAAFGPLKQPQLIGQRSSQ
jgi:CubicO group peptidase (beta-lactamase class C family)